MHELDQRGEVAWPSAQGREEALEGRVILSFPELQHPENVGNGVGLEVLLEVLLANSLGLANAI
jgi:hypothetical protein